MFHASKYVRCSLALAASFSAAHASEAEPSSVSFFAGQKFWFANFEANAIDVQTVIPPGSATPVLRTSLARYHTSDTHSITTLGARMGAFSVFGSVMPTVKSVAGSGLVGGTLSRAERDLGVSYAIGSGLSVSFIWRTGKVSPLVTPATGAALNIRGEQTVTGYLLGVSGSAPLDDRLALYGNLGYGPLRSKSTEVLGPLTRNKGSYTLGEFGLAYRLLEPSEARWLSSVSLQLGYRIQIVAYDDIELPTLRLDGTPLSVERTNARPLTQGMALGLSASF